MGQKKVIKKTEEELLKEGKKLEEAIVKTTVVEKEKAGKTIEKGKIYINATYNNTILTAADEKGNVLAWVSSGSLGFSGPKKATPFAASKLVAAISDKLKKFSFSNIEIIIKGVSGGRDAALKSLASHGFNILSVKDVTPIPHNGPRAKKVRRV